MAMTPEGRVKKAIKALLKEWHIWFYMPVSNGMGVVGIPDFICCWDGFFFAIEAKAPGKRASVTANQQKRMDEIKTANGMVLVVDAISQLEEFLNEKAEVEESSQG